MTDFLRPVSIQRVVRESAVADVPINTTATAPVTAADPVEPGSRTRSRRSVAKVTLPIIGTRAITPSPDTDGRGGTHSRGGNALGDAPVAALTAQPATQPITSIEDLEPADKPSTEPSSWKTKHAARERSAKVHKHRTVRKNGNGPACTRPDTGTDPTSDMAVTLPMAGAGMAAGIVAHMLGLSGK